MMILKLVLNSGFLVLLLASLVRGRQIYRHYSAWRLVDRLIMAAFPVCIVFLVAIGLKEVLDSPFHAWETIRLLPSFLIARGFPHYYPPDQGPVLDMMYGPMTAVAYYPVTIFNHATYATMLGKLLTFSYYFLPVAWVVYCFRDRDRRVSAFAWLCFIGFVLYSHERDVLFGSGFTNHADAPALGLSALACIFLLARRSPRDHRAMALSAACTVLAVWTKQVTLPLLVAMPIYLACADGFVGAGWYAGYLVIIGTGVTLLFGHLFGFDKLWFNLITNPVHQPWEREWIKIQGHAIVELMEECRWIAFMMVFSGIYLYRAEKSRPRRFPAWWIEQPSSLFVWVGIAMIPTALVGRMKVGGGLNALSFSVYFLVIAVIVQLIDLVKRPVPSLGGQLTTTFSKALVLFLVVSSLLEHAPVLTYYYFRLTHNIISLRTNPLREANHLVRSHPDEVYLPWNVLSSFLAEGKLYHFDYAIIDRDLSGFSVSPEHFRANLPAKMRWVAFPPNSQDQYVMRYLPEFTKRVELQELSPGWTVFTRDDSSTRTFERSAADPWTPSAEDISKFGYLKRPQTEGASPL